MARKRKADGKRKEIGPREGIRALLIEAREEDVPPVLTLYEACRSFKSAGKEVAWLAAYDLDPDVAHCANILLYTASQESAVEEATAAEISRAAVPALLGAIQDPRLPDSRKWEILPMYAALSGEDDPRGLTQFFKDFEGIAAKKSGELATTTSAQPSSLAMSLDVMQVHRPGEEDPEPGEASLEMAFALGSHLSAENPDAASAMLCCTAAFAQEYEKALTPALGALETAAETRSTRAAWYLRELGQWRHAGEIGARARQLAEDLTAGGIEPVHHLLCDFSHGLVSGVDGAGSRSVTLFYRTPEGAMDAFSFIVNDWLGILDIWCAFASGDDVADMLKHQARDIPFAPCPVDLAREIFGDALQLQADLEMKVPGSLLVYRPYLGMDPIPVRKRRSNLGAYMLEALAPRAELVEDSKRLAKHLSLGKLDFTSDAAYEFVREKGPKKGGRITKKLLASFAQAIADTEDRENLLQRMAVNLEVESLGGRAKQRQNRIGARTWWAMEKEAVPFHEVPYVLELAKDSIRMIQDNIRMGFANQREANEAGLEMDRLDGPFADEAMDAIF